MNFNNTLIISTEFKELKFKDASQHFFAEIVLIDRTHSCVDPLLYQVKKDQMPDEEDISALKYGILTLQNDPFIMMGEIDSIDKHNKQISLKNGNIITYKYLIINSGSGHENEFTAALNTLFYALLLSKKIPATIGQLQVKAEESSINARALFSQPLSPDVVEKIVRQKLSESDLQSPTNLINTIRKLSEVQL